MRALSPSEKPKRFPYVSRLMPSRGIEYAYYVSIVYSVLADVLGLSIPILAGGMIFGISACCIVQLQSRAKAVYEPIGWLLACATSFLSIQIIIHGISITDDNIRPFITWMLGLIIVHSLCLRPGFSHRFPIVLFVLGAMMLPYLSFSPGEFDRASVGLEVGGSLSHSGGLAEWFGFCAVYFAMLGLETKRPLFRAGAWLIAVGCLFIVTLTVSRGVLIAAVLAITVGFRGLLKRGFIPLLVIIALAGIIYESGLFEQAVSHYSDRGMEETGREKLWPAAIDRIFTSPLVGVGISDIGMSLSSSYKKSPPHNSFLYFALSSGVLPLAFYVAFWIQATRRSFLHAEGLKDGSFRIPYLLYTFVCVMLGDLGFMSFWALLALSVGAGSGISYSTKRRPVMRAVRGRRMAQLLGHRSRAANPSALYRF